ncbi:hypothetical protein DPEC_G00063700 [Dallia pectoralis]|uniref:Uncharacterized protein n=1 Tax=Dallia pectoralis TaxID=75939 RepID=A0ACC2H7R9_DALPE|nr:hypothetical protein DPEC_G00063700 [Dallia pectoralis]
MRDSGGWQPGHFAPVACLNRGRRALEMKDVLDLNGAVSFYDFSADDVEALETNDGGGESVFLLNSCADGNRQPRDREQMKCGAVDKRKHRGHPGDDWRAMYYPDGLQPYGHALPHGA